MTGRKKQIAMVLDAVESGECNTTRDIADATGLPLGHVSNYVSELVADGILRRSGRTIPNLNKVNSGPPYMVFEVVR